MRVRYGARPWGVMLVALFQTLKAGVLLATAALLYFRSGLLPGPESALYPVLYLAMRSSISMVRAAAAGENVLLSVLLLLGLYLLYVSLGLWRMRPSARVGVLLTSGMTLALYIQSTLLSTVRDGSLSSVSFFTPSLHNVHLLLFIDTAIFVYLIRGSTANQFKA